MIELLARICAQTWNTLAAAHIHIFLTAVSSLKYIVPSHVKLIASCSHPIPYGLPRSKIESHGQSTIVPRPVVQRPPRPRAPLPAPQCPTSRSTRCAVTRPSTQ